MSLLVRTFVSIFVIGSASPTLAAWTAEYSEEEGGKLFVADVESKSGILRILCNGKDFNLRFEPSDPGKGEEPHNQKFMLKFAVDGELNRDILLAYEAMDGALATNISKAHPLLAAAKRGSLLTITDPSGRYKRATFTLAGAARALTKLERNCR